MVQPQYDTIHDSPIILQQSFPKRPGTRPGAVILVDRGDQYVVACRYADEETLVPDPEWGQGYYFPHGEHVETTQSVALQEALVLYQKKVEQN